MKKNKRLDKIIEQALKAVTANDKLDQKRIQSLTDDFKQLPLEEAIYALNAFKKGLTNFQNQHTLTVYAPVDLSKEMMAKISKSLGSAFDIQHSIFNLDSSLLAGFKFKIGDEVFDSSLRASLESLKQGI